MDQEPTCDHRVSELQIVVKLDWFVWNLLLVPCGEETDEYVVSISMLLHRRNGCLGLYTAFLCSWCVENSEFNPITSHFPSLLGTVAVL